MGRLNTKITVIDGSDGFSELKIISSRQERQLENHGITMDFSVISVVVEHQVGPVSVESSSRKDEDDREEMFLSQALSQSSIDDYSQTSQSQSQSQSQATSQSQTSQSQGSQEGSQGSQYTEEPADHGEFTIVYEEKNPNSPLVSRPIFR